MEKLFSILIALFVGGILLTLAIGYASDRAGEAQYRQAQGEALVIRAEAESRLTTATASAITTAALLPWFALTILGVLGLAVMALAGAIVVKAKPARIIETRTVIYLPAPGQTRREIWQGINAVNLLEQPQVMVIEQPNYKRIETGVSDEKRNQSR